MVKRKKWSKNAEMLYLTFVMVVIVSFLTNLASDFFFQYTLAQTEPWEWHILGYVFLFAALITASFMFDRFRRKFKI